MLADFSHTNILLHFIDKKELFVIFDSIMSEEAEYYLWVDGAARGPYERAELVEGLMSGQIPKETPIATPESDEWLPISSVIQVAPAAADFDAINFGATMVFPKGPKDK